MPTISAISGPALFPFRTATKQRLSLDYQPLGVDQQRTHQVQGIGPRLNAQSQHELLQT